jgi:hypothetical protein
MVSANMTKRISDGHDVSEHRPGHNVHNGQNPLQDRLNALDAVMTQMVSDGASGHLLWEAAELFFHVPPWAFLAREDEIWWEEQLMAVVERHALAECGRL